MCLFAKKPVAITFTGLTNHPRDPSVDYMKATLTPLLKAFGVEVDAFVLKVKRRGFAPEGGGEVEFRLPNVKELKSINLCDEGMLRRVRGTAVTAKVSPHVANRLVQSARYVLFVMLLAWLAVLGPAAPNWWTVCASMLSPLQECAGRQPA